MELLEPSIIQYNSFNYQEESSETSTDKPFILSNTIASSIEEIRQNHIIPVYVKDNEPVISHADFINTVSEVTHDLFKEETVLTPSIRLSHPIKGRIPEAKDKAAKDLLEAEKTIYYERMAFIIEIPSIKDTIDGNELSLTIGGVKAYNMDNLYSKKGSDEHFKVFIGFQNKVCTNLCVWSDGYIADLKVKSTNELLKGVYELVINYNAIRHLKHLQELTELSLTEKQFAQLIGRCKLYQYLPSSFKRDVPLLRFGDTQIGTVAKDYYQDESFCRMEDGSISLWKLYNLFTGANKSSYIDSFLDKSVNAFDLVRELSSSLLKEKSSWYLS